MSEQNRISEEFKLFKQTVAAFNKECENFMNSQLDIISIQKDPFEGPAIRDERAGDVRVTLNTKEGMKRLHLFPRQARELLDALVAWMDAVQE